MDFNTLEAPVRSDTVQNDGFLSRDRGRGRDSDLADILIGIPLNKDENSDQPTVQARQHRGGVAVQVPGRSGLRHGGGAGDMSFLEIGMYVLMTAFCFAIVIFVVTCFVYASKFRPASGTDDLHDSSLDAIGSGIGGLKILREPRKNRESTQNAHDWVWLGRSTMDRTSVNVDHNGGPAAGGGNPRGTTTSKSHLLFKKSYILFIYSNV